MQKIYSLLRSNKQSGPYTLEELLALQLKPHDLIRVEGKSGGWSYPTEIDTLKMYISAPAKVIEKKEPRQSSEAGPTSAVPDAGIEKFQTVTPDSKHIY